MPIYTPPLRDMQFVLHELLQVSTDYQAIAAYADIDADTINAVLEQAGKFATEVAFPLNIGGDTEGCTLEARGFQRDLVRFHQLGCEVVGISADSADSHAEFCGSEGLSDPLLSDPGGGVSRSYGSWIAPFSQRHTFLIDPQGVLRASWLGVRPLTHSQEVLASLAELQRVPSG